jgi:hypothetical protein
MQGQTSTARARYACPAAAPRPLLRAATRSPAVCVAPLFFWQSGRTALYYARQRNHPEVVALLESAQQGGGAGRAPPAAPAANASPSSSTALAAAPAAVPAAAPAAAAASSSSSSSGAGALVADGAVAGGGAAAAGAAAAGAAAAVAASSSAGSSGAGASKRTRTVSEQGQLDKQLFDAAHDGMTAEVTRLLAAGADPNGYPKDPFVRACARSASLPAAPLPRLASCAALTTRTTPPPHAAGWVHRPDVRQRQGAHGNRAGANRRGGIYQRQGPGTPAPPPPRARCCPPPLAHPPCVPHRCSTWQNDETALMSASGAGRTAVVQALRGAGADLYAKNDVRPPRRRPAPAAARHRSLIRRVHRTAAPSGRMAGPPSTGPARTTTRRSWRCWRRRSRGAARVGRRRVAVLSLLAPPRLPRLARREPASGLARRASKESWTSSSTMRRTASTTRRPMSCGSWLRALAPTDTRTRCVPAPAPAPPRCRPPPRPPRALAMCGTHHPYHAAAARRRSVTPLSWRPAAGGTRRSCRSCWTRGQTPTPGTRYARPAAAPRPLLPAAARSPVVCAAPLFHLAGWLDRPFGGQPQQLH